MVILIESILQVGEYQGFQIQEGAQMMRACTSLHLMLGGQEPMLIRMVVSVSDCTSDCL